MDDKSVDQIHEIKRTLYEDYFVPAHAPRTESDLYKLTHHDLVNVQDAPCYICGIRKSTGGNMETHHFHCEWSLSNSVDWSVMKAAHPDFDGWDKVKPEDPSTFYNFVDSVYNMLVLCDVHHRGKFHGIHAVEHPVWIAQKFMKSDFTFIPASDKALEFVDDLDA
jgi:hypothetical protein